MTLAELNRQAFKTLMDSFGYINAIRFFKQFDMGSGDYAHERHQWLEDLSMEEIWTDIQKRQAK
jgi:hypothetical protein